MRERESARTSRLKPYARKLYRAAESRVELSLVDSIFGALVIFIIIIVTIIIIDIAAASLWFQSSIFRRFSDVVVLNILDFSSLYVICILTCVSFHHPQLIRKLSNASTHEMKKNDVDDNDDENEKCDRTRLRYGADTWPSHTEQQQQIRLRANKEAELKWMEHMIDIWMCIVCTESKIECRFKV